MRLCSLVVALTMVTLTTCAARPIARRHATPTVSRAITILRDRFGVPSIVADRYDDVCYGLGYAAAMDNAERIALNYKMARGRLAEVEGRSQLLQDGFIRSLEVEEKAEAWANALTGPMKSNIESYCAGVSRGIAAQKGKIPDWIQPVTPTDVLALAQLVNSAFALEDAREQLFAGIGSNQFAVAPSRSADHHAILSMDPHLPWNGIFLWYEFAIYTRDFAFRGIAVDGLPFGNMGHTSRVGWSMTNNDPMLYSLYTVKTDPKDPTRYNFHGNWRTFRERKIELRYLDHGEMKTQRQTVKITDWGPMVPFRPIAIKLSTLGPVDPDQIMNLMKARDAFEFRKALAPHAISMFNIVFADTSGNIGYQFNARVPKRDSLFDWRKPVPGDDPRTAWEGLIENDILPHIMNPRSGLLVNCNSAPYFTPLDNEMPTEWPAYITTDQHTTRFDLLSTLLKEDPSVTIANARLHATDTEVPYARMASAELIQFGGNDTDLKEAIAVLRAWNGRADVESRGCGLYAYWMLADKSSLTLAKKAAALAGWTPEEANKAISSLKSAVAAMRKDHGRLDIPWGEMHYTLRGDMKVPTAGYGYVAGDEAAVDPIEGPFAEGVIECNEGSSFRMIVSLDPTGVKSWSILPFGESQNTASPHYADQLPLFAAGRYKPTNFGLPAAKSSAVSRITLMRP